MWSPSCFKDTKNDPQAFNIAFLYNGKLIHYQQGIERDNQQLTVWSIGLSWSDSYAVVASEFVRIKLSVVTRLLADGRHKPPGADEV